MTKKIKIELKKNVIALKTGGVTFVEGGGGGGATNLAYEAGSSNGIVTNTNGTGFTIPLVVGANAGLMSSTQKAKLDGVATGATANSTDAQLRDRSTHTGQQAISTVTDLEATLNGKAPTSHTHSIANVTGLQTALDGKANTSHTHIVADVTGLQTALDAKEATANKNANNGYCGLDAGGKVPIANLPTTLLQYQGVWNASTNSPTLTNPDSTKVGYVYNVSTEGTRFGIDWKLGDWLIYNASAVPEKSDNSDDVTSVNGQTGTVVLTTAHVADSTNKRYLTDAQLAVVSNTSNTNTGDNSTNTTSNAYADGKVADAIADGVTGVAPSQNAVFDALATKQATLVSGTNIKQINGIDILGSGNLVISGGGGITNTQSIVNALIFG